MGHSGRHAPHGRHFFGADTCFFFAQIMQKHHAQPSVCGLWVCQLVGQCCGGILLLVRCQTGSHMQSRAALVQGHEMQLLALWLTAGIGLINQITQRLPVWMVQVVQAQRLGQAQQLAGCWVGHAYLIVLADHNHAFGQVINDQAVDQRLHARCLPVLLGLQFLLCQAQ